MTTGKQFFLVKLDSDHSEYEDRDWEALIKHIRNHDGVDLCWSNHRYPESPVFDPLIYRPPHGIIIACNSFRSALTTGDMLKRIQVNEEGE